MKKNWSIIKTAVKHTWNIIKIIAKHLWQLPQHLVAWCLVWFCGSERYLGEYKGRKVYYHPLMPNSSGEGVCLGNYIFHDSPVWNEGVIAHEYGHSRSSLFLGWLYLPTVGLCSVMNPYSGAHYYSLWCEWWANRLGGVKVVIRNNNPCDYYLEVIK